MPKVSIYICTYNRAELLRESIQSVLKQTYEDLSIIVLDNASVDHTSEVVASFDDPRLRYIRHETNIGGFENWNYALDHAETEYVSVFHDDDRMFPWMVEREVEILDANPDVGLVGSLTIYPMRGDNVIPPSRKKNDATKFEQYELTRRICRQGNNVITCPSAMFRKRSLDTTNLRFRPDVGPVADTYFFLETDMSADFGNIVLLKDPLLEYRYHEGSGRAYCVKHGLFAESHRKCEELILRSGVNVDLTALHAFFIYAELIGYAKLFIEWKASIEDIKKKRKELREVYQWDISDSKYRDYLTIDALGDDVVRVGSEIDFGEVLKKARWLRKKKFPVSNTRLAKWFLKYYIFKKIGIYV